MKVAVLNFSGNVGKTTVSAHLLKPRMGDAPIYSIESVNMGADANGLDVEKMKGKKYGDLVDELMPLDSAIIDVGASNVEDFLKMMQQYDGSHEEFDFFIIFHQKVKTTGFSRLALAMRICRKEQATCNSTGTAAIRFTRLNTILSG